MDGCVVSSDTYSSPQGVGKMVDGNYVLDRQGVVDIVMENFSALINFQSSADDDLNASASAAPGAAGQSASGPNSTAGSEAAVEASESGAMIDAIMKVMRHSTSCMFPTVSQSQSGFRSSKAHL
jgi:hypothetical protein